MENPENVENMEKVVNVENVENMKDPGNVENVKNMDNSENVENIENFENLENVENMENTMNVKNVEDLENLENLENVENTVNVKNVENMENTMNVKNVENLENLENLENVENTENSVNVKNVENMENTMNVKNVENLENLENLENVENMENTVNVKNVENLENLENLENVDNMDNTVNVKNVENMENLENLENVEKMGNPVNVENVEKLENPVKERWPGWPGVNVFRILVPAERVGGNLIGRKGEIIKKICEETKSFINILEGPFNTKEKTVLVYAQEVPDLLISPAMDGLLRILKCIIDENIDPTNVISRGEVCTRILVPPTQARHLIGKQGSNIKSIQYASNCKIIVFVVGEHLPVSALPDDNVIQVTGMSSGVRKAVELIISVLRKFLVDRSIVGVFEREMKKPNACSQNIPPSQQWGTPQVFGATGGGPGYIRSLQYMPPPNPFDASYPPKEISLMNMQPGEGPFSHRLHYSHLSGPGYIRSLQYMPPPNPFDASYPPEEISLMNMQPGEGPFSHGLHHSHLSDGRDNSMGGHVTNWQPHQSTLVTQVTQHMQISLSYADTVIGTNGSNISYIRRSSGATITVQETEGAPSAMTLEITGFESQVQAAQQLIQTFMSKAANNAQNAVGTTRLRL